MVKKIELTRGQFALVDDEDFEWLDQWKWYANWDSHIKGFYAVRNERKGEYKSFKQRRQIIMHRVIMNASKGMHVDHINHNSLDNCKNNLRIVSNRQNTHNRTKKSTSKYPGVYWHKQMKKWRADIRLNGKHTHLGYFTDEREAAKAYEKALRKHAGEELICKLNAKSNG